MSDEPTKPLPLGVRAANTTDLEAMLEQSRKAQAEVLRKQQDAIFTYHTPKPGQPEQYQLLRDTAKQLAFLILDTVPPSTEQQVALNKLREVVMWANSGIAIHGKGVDA